MRVKCSFLCVGGGALESFTLTRKFCDVIIKCKSTIVPFPQQSHRIGFCSQKLHHIPSHYARILGNMVPGVSVSAPLSSSPLPLCGPASPSPVMERCSE